MNEIASCRPSAETEIWAQVRALRISLGETGEQFGVRIGLSKGKVSELESGKYAPAVATAIAIEALSGGKIDAACLCEDVRLARHGATVSARAPAPATGQADDLSGGVGL